MSVETPARLILKDGTIFSGFHFGAPVDNVGEVVFSTGMVGYPEAFSDPSYRGQILVCTYPLIGNYGVPSDGFESDRGQIAGLIVQSYSPFYSHHTATQSLGTWLQSQNISGITGIDTRALTKHLRTRGVMVGRLLVGRKKIPSSWDHPLNRNLVAEVSPRKVRVYGKGGKIRIVAVDCGMKENSVRSFVSRGVELVRVPWDYNYLSQQWDGLFISNGPGDPQKVTAAINLLRQAMRKGKPIFGICLGMQLMALAAGAKTYKLKFGHRSQNQPCREEGTMRSYLTTQNHGYAVDEKTLPRQWRVWFRNANDGSVEGITHATKPYSSVQFHPEAAPGPEDTKFLFDRFLERIRS